MARGRSTTNDDPVPAVTAVIDAVVRLATKTKTKTTTTTTTTTTTVILTDVVAVIFSVA